MYYNRFRFYDSNTGSYLSQDPIGLAGNNPTLYAYVSEPNMWLDPFGLDCKQSKKVKVGEEIAPNTTVKRIKKGTNGAQPGPFSHPSFYSIPHPIYETLALCKGKSHLITEQLLSSARLGWMKTSPMQVQSSTLLSLYPIYTLLHHFCHLLDSE